MEKGLGGGSEHGWKNEGRQGMGARPRESGNETGGGQGRAQTEREEQKEVGVVRWQRVTNDGRVGWNARRRRVVRREPAVMTMVARWWDDEL